MALSKARVPAPFFVKPPEVFGAVTTGVVESGKAGDCGAPPIRLKLVPPAV